MSPTTNEIRRAVQTAAKIYAVDEAPITRTLREVATLKCSPEAAACLLYTNLAGDLSLDQCHCAVAELLAH
jgi:hypothetical protein